MTKFLKIIFFLVNKKQLKFWGRKTNSSVLQGLITLIFVANKKLAKQIKNLLIKQLHHLEKDYELND